MKVYPKIPRYDHPVVPESFFDAEDLVVPEKFDGSSFLFTLYDERHASSYPDPVVNAADGDGSLVFGTRRSIRGSHRDDLEDIDGALHRAVRCLRDGIDADAIRRAHDDHGGPLIVYEENLVYSTLDYGYTEHDLPALVGFDILPYAAIDSMTLSGSPYAETFEGFLSTEAAWGVFDRIRFENVSPDRAFVPATIIAKPTEFDPETYTVPQSSLAGDIHAEGVVARSDSQDRRVKVVRNAFEELNREQFGQDPDDAETGAERLVAMYCTSARIRKTVRSLVIEEGHEFGLHLVEDLYPRVVEDIWAEHWSEIMRLEFEFTPADVYPLVAKRCVTELRKMETNADLNDADPTTI
ncbi:hypothetical protein DJ69_07640 [Halorubrum persicum]|uniref:RNA ligase domain-containing protein n=1 Tax=Halorubrum persicum TaxID=1383844 RepID=A0A2G1WJJ8_9EURY|nr:hypothetical protein [Halorubrum persicum]PHQ39174.1 hypothetical protein DJ69_07640 [Halorubrum persicum]